MLTKQWLTHRTEVNPNKAQVCKSESSHSQSEGGGHTLLLDVLLGVAKHRARGRQADWQTDKLANKRIDWQTDRGRQTDQQTDM